MSWQLDQTSLPRRGEIENGDIRVQIKATDRLKAASGRSAIAVRLEWRDMVYWLNEPLPVILVIYDARADQAWWVYLNETVREEGRRAHTGATLTVRVPRGNVLDSKAIRLFRKFRDTALAHARG